jgi:beta-glucosidase
MFPKSFLWGAASAAYQIEGAAQADGRGASIWDTFTHTPGKILNDDTGDVACNSYYRYLDDVDLLKKIGVGAYRFSIAWPRILPDGVKKLNPAGLAYYDRLVDSLLEAGITPFVTLYHWDLPQALQDRGGWANREIVDAFVNYTEVVVRHLGDRVTYWATHNEPWCIAFLGYYMGVFAPGISDFKTALQVCHHLLLSHGRAVQAIHAINSALQAGIVLNWIPAHPGSEAPADQAAAQRFDGFFNRWFSDPLAGRGYPQDMWDYYAADVPVIEPGDMDQIATPTDFWGINYYNHILVDDNPEGPIPQTQHRQDPTLPCAANKNAIYPQGLYDTLVRVYRDYQIPNMYVCENGAAFQDVIDTDGAVHDPDRIAFLREHFVQAARTIAAGVPLRGYFVWSLLDNFEWASGYSFRFGLTYTDYQNNQRRIIKDSGYWYRDFVRSLNHNGA